MYKNFMKSLKESKITRKAIIKELGICQKALFNKIKGTTEFTLSEAKKIRDLISPGESLDSLFATDGECVHKNILLDRAKDKLEKIANGQLERDQAWDVLALLEEADKHGQA